MSLPSLSVRRRITFIMVFIAILGIGLFGLSQLGIDLYPDIQFPMIFMVSQLSGAGSEEMETLVTDLLEEAAARVKNVRKVSSSSSPGIASIMAEFSWGYDLNQAETDLRRALDLYEDFLPEDASKPFVLALDPSAQPILFISFSSDVLSEFDLRKLVEEEIEPLINRIDGVGSTMTQGGLVRQIRVEVDPVRLNESGITLSAVVAALGAVRNDQPAGAIETGGMKLNVRVESAYHSLEEIEQLVVGGGPAGPIRVRDVAIVYDGTAEMLDHVRVNGESAVVLFVMKRSDANTVNVAREVTAELGQIERLYGDRLDTFVLFDQSEFITGSIGNLSQTAIQAFVIAVVVLLLFLRSWRSSIIVGISIPMSVIATFAIMYFVDVDINFISLAGLALAVGMLVDNSIVVLESVFRYREDGAEARDASVRGSMEVGMAITASTLTTLAVFVPILFVPGIAGQLFRDMSLTISFSLVVSLFVALSLVPLLTSRARKLEPRRGHVARTIGNSIARLNARYGRTLEWSVHHRKLMIILTIVVFVLSMLMLRFVPTDFLAEGDDGFLSVDLNRTIGTDLESTDSTVSAIEASVRELVPEEHLVGMYTRVGESQGVAAIFGTSASHEGSIFVRLVKSTERDVGVEEYEDSIRAILEHMPDVEYTLGDRGPFAGTAPIEINIFGDDLGELQEFSERLKAGIERIEGTRDVRSSLEEQIPELSFVPDAALLSMRGLSPTQLSREVMYGLMGTAATVYRDAGEEYDVFVRYPERFRDSREDVEYAPVHGVPLTSWGQLEERMTPNTIRRINQTRVATVSSAVSGRSLGEVTADVMALLDTIDTRGLRVEIGGQAEDQRETFLYLGIAILVAAALVYMVMASQFESLLEPFIIILIVPMALIGVVWMLMITQTVLSVVALIGVLMLAGIVVNNGIVMVDYANQLRRQGMDVVDAIVRAGTVRMRPILMTASTTALAMVPLALGLGEGGETWAPMAVTVIGGLVAATFLTLLVEPCLYVVLGCRKRFNDAGSCTPTHLTAPPAKGDVQPDSADEG